MTGHSEELRFQLAAAVRQAAKELRRANSELFGFALCTDDDVRGFYHLACTREWVRENEAGHPDIGYIYVGWVQAANSAAFDPLSRQFDKLADETCANDTEWARARDQRFNLLVLALGDCRRDGTFSPDTLLCAGSTDPSNYMEALAMKGVDALNTPTLANEFARALGYEKYRSKV